MKSDTNNWQPIETAPMDGTLVLIAFDYHPTAVGRFEYGSWIYWPCMTEGGDSPTHWQPLPEPPVERSKSREQGT